jgi:hypothetical protein
LGAYEKNTISDAVVFFSVFGGILPAMYRWFSKKLSTSAVVHQKYILPDY